MRAHETATVWPFAFRDSPGGALHRRQWWWLVALFVALHYLGLGIASLTGNFDPEPNHDHVRVMRQVLEHGYPKIAVWPPLFAYYMAVKWTLTGWMGIPYWTGKLFLDVVLVVASGILATLLAQALTRNRWIAICAGVGMVGAPIFLLSSAEGLAVLLFQPFFLLSLLLLVRELQRESGPRMAGFLSAGATMGLACLVRANPQFLFVLLLPFVAWLEGRRGGRRPRLRGVTLVVAFLVGQFVVMAPWLVRQRHLGKSGVFTAPVIYYGFLDGIKRHPGDPVSDWLREQPEMERSFETVVRVNSHWLRENPVALLKLYALKFVKTWYLSDSGRWDVAILLLHAPLWILAMAGVARWLRRRPVDPALVFVLLIVLYMWTVSALVSGLARYLAPLYGLIGLLAGVVLAALACRHAPGAGRPVNPDPK